MEWQYRDLKQVNDPAPGKSLPKGYITDGSGHVFQVPTSGYSKTTRVGNYNYRYDYKNHEIQMLDTSNKVVYDMGLSASSWFDNPEYWCKQLHDEFEDEVRHAMKYESIIPNPTVYEVRAVESKILKAMREAGYDADGYFDFIRDKYYLKKDKDYTVDNSGLVFTFDSRAKKEYVDKFKKDFCDKSAFVTESVKVKNIKLV